VTVFADYLSEGLSAETSATQIRGRSEALCGIGWDRARVSTDPAGDSRTAIGPTVRAEYLRQGLRGKNGLEAWPTKGRKTDALQFLEALLMSADGSVTLTVHPNCKKLITAFQSYTRAKRAGQWMDYAEDPQHPWEDLIDPLVGGLKLEFPESRMPPANLYHIKAGMV
jgi:hypothetical protein